jgi:hypothetical protein
MSPDITLQGQLNIVSVARHILGGGVVPIHDRVTWELICSSSEPLSEAVVALCENVIEEGTQS